MVLACACACSRVWLFVAPQTIALEAPLSVGFPRQEYWSGLPFPLPGGLPDPRIKPISLTSPALVGRFFTTCATWNAIWPFWSVRIYFNLDLDVAVWSALEQATCHIYKTSFPFSTCSILLLLAHPPHITGRFQGQRPSYELPWLCMLSHFLNIGNDYLYIRFSELYFVNFSYNAVKLKNNNNDDATSFL